MPDFPRESRPRGLCRTCKWWWWMEPEGMPNAGTVGQCIEEHMLPARLLCTGACGCDRHTPAAAARPPVKAAIGIAGAAGRFRDNHEEP